ncbi:MAG: hypothetical protein ACR2KP_16925 [Egibacteraceae bacterium]
MSATQRWPSVPPRRVMMNLRAWWWRAGPGRPGVAGLVVGDEATLLFAQQHPAGALEVVDPDQDLVEGLLGLA